MTTATRRLLLWGPRILGILLALFLAAFAMDAIDEGIAAVLIHLTPTFALLLAVAASWRREWVGGAVFSLFAVVLAVPAWSRGGAALVVSALVVSGPLLAVGLLFLWDWRHHDELHASR